MLLVSSAFTTVLTVISFYIEYEAETEAVSDSLSEIQNGIIPGLSKAAWDENYAQMESLAQGVVQAGAVTKATIYDEDGKEIIQKNQITDRKFRYLENFNYDLMVDADGSNYKAGRLSLVITLDPMYERLIRKALYFFFSQGLKTLFVSLALLYVFNWYVVRHIKRMSQFLVKIDVKGGEFQWTIMPESNQKSNKHYNELDILAGTINELSHGLSRHNRDMEENLRIKSQDLRIQEGMALNAARQASLGEMAGAIAHEVNNPLAVISLQNEILMRNVADSNVNLSPEAVEKGHMKIKGMVNRVSEVVESMMFLTLQTTEQKTEYISLNALSGHVKNISGEALRSLGISLTIHYLGVSSSDLLRCNPVLLAQVLVSLIHNSREAIKDKSDPWIRLEYINLGNSLSISVVDCGEGIPKEYRDKIFDPFFTTKKIGEGSGLGLSTSQKIIRDHGWKLYLDPNSRYSMFCIEVSNATDSLKAAA